MKWKNNKNLKPEIILKKFDEIRNSENPFNFMYIDVIAALSNMIDFPKNFLFTTNQKILKEAIFNIKEELNKDNLMNELQKLANLENSKKENIYKILTSISIGNPLPIKSIKIGKSKIDFMENYPKKYSSRDKIFEDAKDKLDLENKSYTKIIITIKEKSEEMAINQAFNDLDLLRAIFSLELNPSAKCPFTKFLSFEYPSLKNLSFEISKNTPINIIRLGRYHTIHDINGKNINSKRYWYESNYEEAMIFYPNQKDIKLLKKSIKWALSQLEKCKFSNIVEQSLLRYVRAFDEKDPNIAYLQIWSALENFVTNEKNNKNDVIKRCSFLFKDSEYYKQILEHLREYRNESVHSGIRSDEVKYYCFQVQRFFKQLMFFCLARVDEFHSIEELYDFLDYTDDISKLEKDKKMLEKVILFRNGNNINKTKR